MSPQLPRIGPASLMRVFAITLLLCCIFALQPSTLQPPVHADNHIIYVNGSAVGSNNGSSWQNAFTTFQGALAAATAGDEIWVAKGLYRTPNVGGVGVPFALKRDVALYGGFVGTEATLSQRDFTTNITVLSADTNADDITDANGIVVDIANIVGTNALHVVTALGTSGAPIDGDLRLDGFVLTGGMATAHETQCSLGGCGGGLFAEWSGPTLANLTITGNLASYGAGLYFYGDSTPTLTNIKVTNNKATVNGGGMHAQVGAAPILTTVEFSGNIARRSGGGVFLNNSSAHFNHVNFIGNQAHGEKQNMGGGGMLNYAGSPTLTNVTFIGNEAVNWGGGLANLSYSGDVSSATLTRVTFRGNRAAYGGGLSNHSANSVLTTVFFIGNWATWGGGIFNGGGECSQQLTNVTLSGNRAERTGGGISLEYCDVTLTNVTMSGNQATSASGGLWIYASRITI